MHTSQAAAGHQAMYGSAMFFDSKKFSLRLLQGDEATLKCAPRLGWAASALAAAPCMHCSKINCRGCLSQQPDTHC